MFLYLLLWPSVTILAKLLNKTHENRWLAMTWILLLIRPKWWYSRRVSRECITSIDSNLKYYLSKYYYDYVRSYLEISEPISQNDVEHRKVCLYYYTSSIIQ